MFLGVGVPGRIWLGLADSWDRGVTVLCLYGGDLSLLRNR